MLLKEDTIAIQNQLADYCRDGEIREIEGSNPDRLHHYRRLVYNVMYGLLERAFPIAKSILEEWEFKSLVDTYLVKHKAQEPQVWKVPGEFFRYLELDAPLWIKKYPYLLDLLKMEWSEIQVFNMAENEVQEHDGDKPKIFDVAVVNPDYKILGLNYPVYKGNWDTIAEMKGRYYLLMYRHQDTHKVHFMEITLMLSRFIKRLEGDRNMDDTVVDFIGEFALQETVNVRYDLLEFADKLYEKGFVLGCAE